MPWLAAVIPAVIGGAQAISGAVQKKKTKEEAERLAKERPKIGKDPNADLNYNLLKSELANGMSAKAEQAYKDISESEFSSTLGSFLRGGGDVNSVGDIYGNSQEGAMKLALMKDNLRLTQIKNLIDQSKEVDERNYVTPLQFNQFAPWADEASANSGERVQADQRMWEGIGMVGSAPAQYGAGEAEDNLYNPEKQFVKKYGRQGEGAYNYASTNGMNYGQYKRQGKKIGNSLNNFGY